MKTYHFTIQSDHDSKRIDQVVFELLSCELQLRPVINLKISKGLIRKLVVAGAVYLNGKRIRIASRSLRAGSKLKIYLDVQKISSGHKEFNYKITAQDILFEDNELIFVNKVAGIPTQPTLDEARNNLYKSLQDFLDLREGKKTYLALHHRLDRETSGVIMFSKSKSINSAITGMFKDHLFQKTYIAISVCDQKLPLHLQVDNFLGITSHRGKQKKMGSVRSGGDRAITDITVLDNNQRYYLLKALPKTGRTHQIRTHLAGLSAPIFGDSLYGKEERGVRTMLHAFSMSFLHPITMKPLSVSANLPLDMLSQLKSLKLAIPEGMMK